MSLPGAKALAEVPEQGQETVHGFLDVVDVSANPAESDRQIVQSGQRLRELEIIQILPQPVPEALRLLFHDELENQGEPIM